ncbi:MAG: DUF1501 domain-containing protein [Pseudarcicella sp.]|nr:DUF1501 domain-containing protein [Pseudarcicella sp.]MBP6411719.1 DUF1501 domain-containing protein [Pseudarcicella sp.]
MNSRRVFLKNSGLALFGIGITGIPNFVKAAVDAHKSNVLFNKNKTLICIFQRGAMDGLMAVCPFTDKYLKEARPTLFMEPAGNKSLIDLDGKFGLHPSLKPFESLFREKRMAIVHGMGSPNTTRSHFDAQDYMESGTPFNKGTSSGWLNRVVGQSQQKNPSPFQAVSITTSLPRSLYGDNSALAISNIADFKVQLKGNKIATNTAAKSFEDLYDQASSDLLKETSKESFDAIKILEQSASNKYQPNAGVSYPNSALGNSLKQIAQLVKMNVGLEVAFAESGGWDTHNNQGTETGNFAKNADDLSACITALWNDLGALQDDVTIMTMTEFGRTVKQNGTNGTDHGRASCSFIIGNHVNGGIVHHNMKSLDKQNLEDGRDLPVSTDFRAIFSEVANKHLKVTNNKLLFPDWKGDAVGVMK